MTDAELDMLVEDEMRAVDEVQNAIRVIESSFTTAPWTDEEIAHLKAAFGRKPAEIEVAPCERREA